MKKAFSLVELLIVITLSGVMAVLFYSYTNYSYLKNQSLKTTLQTHFSSITAAVLNCESLSDTFPTQGDDSIASDTLVAQLKCQTTPTYILDGYDSFFMPKAPTGFDAYTATQNGSEFYIQTAVDENSELSTVLNDLNASYSANQYSLSTNAGKLTATYYISR